MQPVYAPLTIPTPILLVYLTTIMGGFNPFPQKYIHLFQGQYFFTAHSKLADLREATFQGYAFQTSFNYGTPFIDRAGNVVMSTGNHFFTATGPGNPNLIGGWYLTDAAITALSWGQNLDVPVGVSKAGDVVLVEPYFMWPASK